MTDPTYIEVDEALERVNQATLAEAERIEKERTQAAYAVSDDRPYQPLVNIRYHGSNHHWAGKRRQS